VIDTEHPQEPIERGERVHARLTVQPNEDSVLAHVAVYHEVDAVEREERGLDIAKLVFDPGLDMQPESMRDLAQLEPEKRELAIVPGRLIPHRVLLHRIALTPLVLERRLPVRLRTRNNHGAHERPALGVALHIAHTTIIPHHPIRVTNGSMRTANRSCYRIFAITCPYTSDKGWRQLRDHHPDQWAEAVAFDRAIRAGSARANANGVPLRGQAYLHPSLVPLDQAPIDPPHVDRKFRHLRLVSTGERWEGDPDGFSPWACRSGPQASSDGRSVGRSAAAVAA